METYEIVYLVIVGVPLVLAAIWIAGFVVTVLVSPIIAAYEDAYGWAKHPHAHRTKGQRGRDLRAFSKRAGTRIGHAWRSSVDGIRSSEALRHPFAGRSGRAKGHS